MIFSGLNAGAALEGAQSGAAAAQSAAAAAPPADSDNALSDDDLTLLLWPEAPEGGRGLSDGDVYE